MKLPFRSVALNYKQTVTTIVNVFVIYIPFIFDFRWLPLSFPTFLLYFVNIF